MMPIAGLGRGAAWWDGPETGSALRLAGSGCSWQPRTLLQSYRACVSPGAGTSHTDTKAAISSLLAEYLGASRDVAEAARRLRELGVPFFHHELVKQALLAAIESAANVDSVVALLGRCGLVRARGLHGLVY